MSGATWRRALVTGASSGIGEAFARRLAAEGAHLVLVARRRQRLDAVAAEVEERHGVRAEVLAADLLAGDDLQAVTGRLADQAAPVDLLVNNAGYGSYGRFVELDPAREEAMVRLNAAALVPLTHAAARAMRARGRGAILNVSSNAGFQPVPYNATYAATKAFVTNFSQALHEELRADGVTVTALCPGFVRTGFQQAADIDRAVVPEWLWLSADQVAAAGLEAVRRGRAQTVPALPYRVAGVVGRLSPRAGVRRVVGEIARRRLLDPPPDGA